MSHCVTCGAMISELELAIDVVVNSTSRPTLDATIYLKMFIPRDKIIYSFDETRAYYVPPSGKAKLMDIRESMSNNVPPVSSSEDFTHFDEIGKPVSNYRFVCGDVYIQKRSHILKPVNLWDDQLKLSDGQFLVDCAGVMAVRFRK